MGADFVFPGDGDAKLEEAARLLHRPDAGLAKHFRQGRRAGALNFIMDVGELNVIPPQLMPLFRHILMEEHRGLFDGEGSGRLQKRVQRRVLMADGQDAPVQPPQPATGFGCPGHGFAQQLESGCILEEAGFESLADAGLLLGNGQGLDDGADFLVTGPVKESVVDVQEGALRLPRRLEAAAHGRP